MQLIANFLNCHIQCPNVDEFVKRQKMPFPVIRAEAGIQYFQKCINTLDSGTCPGPRSGVHRSDDFLRDHPCSIIPIFQFWVAAMPRCVLPRSLRLNSLCRKFLFGYGYT
jgi:hypothetical protein